MCLCKKLTILVWNSISLSSLFQTLTSDKFGELYLTNGVMDVASKFYTSCDNLNGTTLFSVT